MGHDINQHTHPPSPPSTSPRFPPSIRPSILLTVTCFYPSLYSSVPSLGLTVSLHPSSLPRPHLSPEDSIPWSKHSWPDASPAYLPSLLGLALLFCPHSPSFHVSSSHPTPPPPFRPQVRTIGWFRFIRREHPTSDEESRPVQISRPCDTGYVHMGCNINPIKAMLSCKEHFWRS